MAYDLFIGDRLFSSWSLRGWLMLEAFNLPCNVTMTGLYTGRLAADLAPLHPARFVPVLRCPDGTIVGETLAIAETLAERHPKAGHWPGDPALRARARWLCAEMASSFQSLRSECPMQLQHVNAGFRPSSAVMDDLSRIQTIWNSAREMVPDAQWLMGAYSLVDVFYTPVAARIIGYALPVDPAARDYCERLLRVENVRQWRDQGLEVHYDPSPYPDFPPLADWPVS